MVAKAMVWWSGGVNQFAPELKYMYLFRKITKLVYLIYWLVPRPHKSAKKRQSTRIGRH